MNESRANRSAVGDLEDLFIALSDDVNTCLNSVHAHLQQGDLAATDLQFWGRALVRATFAMIEGLIFSMKQCAVEQANLGMDFAPAEVALLLEEDYDLDDRGLPVTRPARISLLKNIKFAFRIYARASYAAYELDVSESGWDALKKSLKVRDRLMHPKRLDDVHLSPDDLMYIFDAGRWFMRVMNQCMSVCRQGLTMRTAGS